jgi:hypothetical protein
MNYYGFDFQQRNAVGLGAILHDIMMALQYCEQNDLTFAFTREGYEIPRFNGSFDDNPQLPNQYWHTYFQSFPLIDSSKCIGLWPKYVPNTKVTEWTKAQFADLLQNRICVFYPHIQTEIETLVKNTPFCKETDIVLHLRRSSDKKSENPAYLPIQTYIEECEHSLQQEKEKKTEYGLSRIYICTDQQEICNEIKDHFKKQDIDVVWDISEPDIAIHELRCYSHLPKSIAQKETMNSFKNLFIMKNAKYVIGGRMSYFFRIGELLGYPNHSINMQDNDKFGIAPYSSIKESIRPYYKNTIVNFIDNQFQDDTVLASYNQLLDSDKIVNIPHFISESVLKEIQKEIEVYPWWLYTTIPNNNEWTVEYSKEINETQTEECLFYLEKKKFTYRFRRSIGDHYSTCSCISCKLNDTVRSFPVTDTICKIVGCKRVTPREIFISNYGKDDFLSIHHDIKKGDISVTFSLTSDWDPTYGGILHFCDNQKNIYKSIVPKWGSMTIFKLDPNNGIDHFVSTVNVDKNRYSLVVWYNQEEI